VAGKLLGKAQTVSSADDLLSTAIGFVQELDLKPEQKAKLDDFLNSDLAKQMKGVTPDLAGFTKALKMGYDQANEAKKAKVSPNIYD